MRAILGSILAVLCAPSAFAQSDVTGVVRAGTAPLPGIFVTARDSTRGVAFSTQTNADGGYRLRLEPGAYVVTAHARGWRGASRRMVAPGAQDFSLAAEERSAGVLPPHRFLSLLPDGDEKRRFVVDCLGCHSLNPRIVLDANGRPWDEKGWAASTGKMLSFAGHKTGFPILPPDREPKSTAAFAAAHLSADAIRQAVERDSPSDPRAAGYRITEYDLPDPTDFPHDLMRDGRGRILITGMFSGLMYVLDPATARFETVEIPVEHANPRALTVDHAGDWWVLCGFPHKIARRKVKNGKWDVFDIGMYGHSIGIDTKRRVWFNGHFTRDPVAFGYVDASSGKTHTLEAPATPMPPEQGSPIPYELRVGPDGTVWITELAGNRLIRHTPESGETKAYTLPASHSGPRRFDVGPDGVVWIPEFATGRLARFDPVSERFEEFDLPVRDSLPYCARVDARRGRVWISLCAADAIARFDIRSRHVELVELPARDAFIRHLDIDPETGAVWGAYSHSPNLETKIVRLDAAE